MKKKFRELCIKADAKLADCKTGAEKLIKDRSGASSIVDIAVGLLVAVAIGAIALAAVKTWAPTFFQKALDSVTSSLNLS